MKAFKKIDIEDYATNVFQDNVETVFNDISKKTLIDGVLIKNVALVSGQDNLVPHGLGRPLQFWVLARQNTNTTVWEVTTTNPTSFLNLRCGSNCTVSLWVG